MLLADAIESVRGAFVDPTLARVESLVDSQSNRDAATGGTADPHPPTPLQLQPVRRLGSATSHPWLCLSHPPLNRI